MKKQTFLKITALSLAMSAMCSTHIGYAQNMESVFSNLEAFTSNLIAKQQETGNKVVTAAQASIQEKVDLSQLEDLEELHLAQTLSDQLGKPYVYGAYGPDSFDCSGLIYYSFGLVGKTVPRTSKAQGEGGQLVEKSDLKFGDLVFFDTRNTDNLQDITIDTADVLSLFAGEESGDEKTTFSPREITHSGVYIGEGKFIHASSGSIMKVVVEELESKYFAQRYIYAKRY